MNAFDIFHQPTATCKTNQSLDWLPIRFLWQAVVVVGQVEAKITNTVGYAMGRGYHSVAKHFRIRRTQEVDALLGLANIEVQHLTTYKGIGKHDAKAGVLKQLGEPDHVRSLQNYSSYEYYFEENVTLFYRGRQVHTVTLDVPDHVKEEVN